MYVGAGDTVTVAQRSGGWLTFRARLAHVLCAGSAAGIGDLGSTGTGPTRPVAALRLDRRILVDTGAASRRVRAARAGARHVGGPRGQRPATPAGSPNPQAIVASTGAVRLCDDLLPTTDTTLDCGDGVALLVAGTAAPTSEPPPSSSSPVPSLTPAPSKFDHRGRARPEPRPDPRPDDAAPNAPQNPPTTVPTTPPTTPPTTAPTTPTTPPPDRTPPVISGAETGGTIYDPQCFENTSTAGVFANVSDAASGVRSVVARYTFANSGRTGQVTMSGKGGATPAPSARSADGAATGST